MRAWMLTLRAAITNNVLQAAARYSRLELVQTLLDVGVDVNAQGGVYANALASAKQRGHETVA